MHPGAGVQHTLLDRGTRGAGIDEDHRIGVGVVVECVPRGRRRDVGFDRVRLDSGLDDSNLERLGGNVNGLCLANVRNLEPEGSAEIPLHCISMREDAPAVPVHPAAALPGPASHHQPHAS